MKSRGIRLLALVLSLVFLAGCSVRIAMQDGRPIPEAKIPSGSPNLPHPTQPPQARTDAQRLYGSVGLLAFPSVLVSVYLNEKNGRSWQEEDIAATRQNLALAVEWITEQAAEYNAAPKIMYDDGTEDSGLFYTFDLNTRFIGGDKNESDEYLDQMDALCAKLDTQALHEKYGTSSVGFLFFLPLEGCSFTMVHYLEDGDDFYHEYTTLYQYDMYSDPGTPDGPAVYAHEILHLYGAPDLYEDSSDYYVTPELLDYVLEQWPDTIMYDTYTAEGAINYFGVDQIIDPLTAYRLGLSSRFPGMEQFPAVSVTPPGSFTGEGAPGQSALSPGIAA